MDIASVTIERADDSSYCGLMTVREADGTSRIWWSVERLDATRVRVGFVQGEREGWLEAVELHAPRLSDAILEAIAHRPRHQPAIA